MIREIYLQNSYTPSVGISSSSHGGFIAFHSVSDQTLIRNSLCCTWTWTFYFIKGFSPSFKPHACCLFKKISYPLGSLLHLIGTLIPYTQAIMASTQLTRSSLSRCLLTHVQSKCDDNICSSFFQLQFVGFNTKMLRSKFLIRLNHMLRHQSPLS